MAEIRFNGVVNENHALTRLFKVSNDAAIVKGDILVLANTKGGSGAGYLMPWASGTNCPFAVAIEDCSQPSADGGASVLAAIISDALLVRVDATGVAQSHVGQYCNIDGAQSVDVTASSRAQALIVEAEVALGKALVILRMTPTTDSYVDQLVS